ncbi:hypothetical protein GG344DRAFT_71321 [Lentinula edodes]|nr:hypothetical protein GG344DRAFT_71321 [Lentinula edodes]
MTLRRLCESVLRIKVLSVEVELPLLLSRPGFGDHPHLQEYDKRDGKAVNTEAAAVESEAVAEMHPNLPKRERVSTIGVEMQTRASLPAASSFSELLSNQVFVCFTASTSAIPAFCKSATMSSESPTPNVEMRIAEVGGDGNGLHRVQARDADRSVLEAIDANGILDANACAQFLQRNRLLLGGDSGGEKEGEPVAEGAHGAILVVRFLLVDAAFFLLFFNEAERRSEGSGKCRRVNGVEQETEARKKAWVFLVTGLFRLHARKPSLGQDKRNIQLLAHVIDLQYIQDGLVEQISR